MIAETEMYVGRLERFAHGAEIDLRTVDPAPDAPEAGGHHLLLSGRVMMHGSDDATCTLKWVYGRIARICVGDAEAWAKGGRAILYFDLVGRIEGTGAWVTPTEIDVAISAPEAKWLRLQEQFALLEAMAPADREDLRGCRRIALDRPEVALSLPDGRTTTACIRDASRSGAAVRSGIVPDTGSIVTLGSTRGRVVRMLDDGFAVAFLRLLPLERFGPAYGL